MTGQDFDGGVRRHSFRHRDVEGTERFFAETCGRSRILSGGDSFEFGTETLDAGGVTLSELWIVDDLDMRFDPTADRYDVQGVHGGRMSWRLGSSGDLRFGAGDVAVPPLVGDYRYRGEDLDVDSVALDAQLVAEFAEHVHGVDAERFRVTGLLPLSRAHARRWSATAQHVRDHVLGNPMLLTDPIHGEAAFRRLASRFLATFPNTVLAEAVRRSDRARNVPVPRRLAREITDHLRAHAGSPVAPRDLARLTGRPAVDAVPALRRAGVDPAQVLWHSRLEGARRDLLGGDAASRAELVRRIADRWGFLRVDRFRISYAHHFGETPEDTTARR